MSKSTSKPKESSLITDSESNLLDKYPSNRKSVKKSKSSPIVDKPPRKMKKSRWGRFLEVFVGGEDAESLGDYIMFDVLVPTIKNTITEIVTNGVEMILFGDERPSSRRNIGRERGRSYISYGGVFNRDDSRDRRPSWRRGSSRRQHDFENLIFDSRSEAEAVLGNMSDMVIDYGEVSVADLYDLSGIDSNFTDNKFGWDDLRTSVVKRVRGGYSIFLPSAITLKD